MKGVIMNLNNLRPTWLEIDLDTIGYNIREVQQHLEDSTDIMAIVKADAYGHGAVEVSKLAIQKGVRWLGVATVEEGVRLREEGIDINILILGTVLSNQIEDVVAHNLTPTVYSYDLAKRLNQLNQKIKIQLKIDTGMGRIGLLVDEAVTEIKKIANLPNIIIEGIFTHFAVADENREYTKEQLTNFNQIIADLEKEGIDIPIKHAANSAAIIDFPKAYFNLVRMGIVMYGLYPDSKLSSKMNKIIRLRPAMVWRARIVHIKELDKGKSISYGCTYTTTRKTKIATLPVGYHDGYSRRLSGGSVLVNGQRREILGRVCMDQMMIDVTDIDVKVGDIVTLLGRDNEEVISTEELADKVGTINYEIISRVGPRVPKVFYQQGEVIGIKGEVE